MGWYHRPRRDRCLNHAWFAHGVWVCPANRRGTDNIGSGIHGNISQCEDIIDLVLLFVVGECQDRVVSRTVGNIQSNAVW